MKAGRVSVPEALTKEAPKSQYEPEGMGWSLPGKETPLESF